MPSLLDVQHAIRRSIVERDDGEILPFVVDDGLDPRQRLAVYRNTYASTLTSTLRLTYPAVDCLVGVAFFDGASQVFTHQQPPRCANLDEYGEGFADFLGNFTPAAALPYLADVARLEWAVNVARHADDAEPLDARRLACLAQVDHDRVHFVAHPSIGLLRVEYPADEIWRAVLARDDAVLAAIDAGARPRWLLVERMTSGIEVACIDESAWRFASQLFAGRPLAVARQAVSDIAAPTLLAQHLAAGRLVAFDLADTAIDGTTRQESRA